jgi:hypothetical protein
MTNDARKRPAWADSFDRLESLHTFIIFYTSHRVDCLSEDTISFNACVTT